MKAFTDDRQQAHAPQSALNLGVMRPSREAPERITRLRVGAQAAGCQFEAPPDVGLAPIAAVHSAEYLTFLQTIHARWVAMPGASEQVIPNVHPRARSDSYPSSPVGLAGYHMADAACPIGAETWEAAYWSAQSTIAGADCVAAGEHHAYVLSRPPGHHAYADMAGGFCFLNNAAIAAERLRAAGRRPAILDIDVHHGNGTQGIFYHRADVLTVSLHGDPSGFYPFYWGHTQERGQGVGQGWNLNVPLPFGTGDDAYLTALDDALARVQAAGADCIVVALGLDASEHDPFQALSISTRGFERIGAAIAGLGLPLLLVQEGGYLCDALSDNLTAALTGVQSA
ncbi:MAG: histone deacetylase family protein [Roseovarius sp.]